MSKVAVPASSTPDSGHERSDWMSPHVKSDVRALAVDVAGLDWPPLDRLMVDLIGAPNRERFEEVMHETRAAIARIRTAIGD